jgi:hypothetical protein
MAKPGRKDGALTREVETFRAALEKIHKEASRRFEGESCPRCLAIESLAAEALRSASATDGDTSPIDLKALNELLEKKKS